MKQTVSARQTAAHTSQLGYTPVGQRTYRGIDRSRPATRRPVSPFEPRRGATDRRSAITVSRAAHPLDRAASARPSWLATIAAGLVSVAVVLAIVGLAQWRTAQLADNSGVVTVEVHRGEALSDVARRVAPDRPVAEMVSRILDLNGMSSAGVVAGQSLLVPAALDQQP
ncbi:hypothetical protein FOS14_16995 [Skermania sp. ID1734]|uniref:hypothetical protein n=1 Tax=Skermania sp. ID1734 TaxID=2597516 RepID=UPI00117E66FC|nr:hypothetical protein [Skermania sp. ID1734]TSD96058.1 hypothetical protein FOS14_16995 [Skermania sp. ID1734]